jgi:hypothetical protein
MGILVSESRWSPANSEVFLVPKSPQMSLTNLIEYAAGASAARRTSIIEQYLSPKVYKFDWHGASDAVFYHRACGSSPADELIEQEKRRQKALLTGEKKKDVRPKHIIELMELLETSDIRKMTEGLRITRVETQSAY